MSLRLGAETRPYSEYCLDWLGLPFHDYLYFRGVSMRVSIGPALKEASRGVVVVVRRSDP